MYGTYNQNQGGKLLADAFVQQPSSSQTQITGNFTSESAKNLANLLNDGSLPVTLTPISASDVGAQLGQESVNQSLLAGALGLVIVIIFMISLYRLPGAAREPRPLLLRRAPADGLQGARCDGHPGQLDGFVLSVGMAVDANVLIFERLKEELRAGGTMSAAVERAVSRAWPAIRDSNTSTLITAVILYAFNTGDVQGLR